ncbi:5913_t:CDS:2, partial [Scutellospora calospora]
MNRPSAKEIYKELDSWSHIINKSWDNIIDDLNWNNKKSEIKRAFQAANSTVPKSFTTLQGNFRDTFQFVNTFEEDIYDYENLVKINYILRAYKKFCKAEGEKNMSLLFKAFITTVIVSV